MMYGLYAEGKLIIHGVLIYDVRVVQRVETNHTWGSNI